MSRPAGLDKLLNRKSQTVAEENTSRANTSSTQLNFQDFLKGNATEESWKQFKTAENLGESIQMPKKLVLSAASSNSAKRSESDSHVPSCFSVPQMNMQSSAGSIL
jgi:hypothetical protein